MSTAHEMIPTRLLEPGVEEWSCPQCGRRFWMRRPPAFAKIVLDRGDEQTPHVSSAGGLRGLAVDAPPPLDDLPSQAREWLAGHGIEW
jgi:hypothetical protein